MLSLSIICMDSQLTLVNPSPAFTLTFNKDSVTNATLYDDSEPLYTIATATASATTSADLRTDVFDTNSRKLIVTIIRKSVMPDTIIFTNRNNGKSIRISKWLKEQKLADGYPVTLLSTEVGNYLWKSDQNYRLALYSEDNLEVPVVYATSSPPTLHFGAGTRDFVDLILSSFTILEHKLRLIERRFQRAAGMVVQDRTTVMGNYVGARG